MSAGLNINYSNYFNSPSEKQIKFVEDICRVLRINDFPSGSWEFTKTEYSRFISNHIEEYKYALSESSYDYDELYDLFPFMEEQLY